MQLNASSVLVRSAFAVSAFGFVAEYILKNLGLQRNSVHSPWSFFTFAIASHNIFEFAFGTAALMAICAAISQESAWNLEEISWMAMVSIISGALAFQLYSMIRSFLAFPTFEYIATLNPLILCASLVLLQSSADKVILKLGIEFKVQLLPFALMMLMQVLALIWFRPGLIVVNLASWFGAFVYLRFIRVWEGSRGDHSYALAFENMVPVALKPIASKLGNVVFTLGTKLDRSGLLAEWNITEAPFAAVLPAEYSKQEIERRREIGAKFMNERQLKHELPEPEITITAQ